MAENKIKNTITRSFEIQDYLIEGTDLSEFWAHLISKEELTVEVTYSQEDKKAFLPSEVENILGKVCRKCDSFKSQVPENITCEVTFEDFNNLVYTANQAGFEIKARELNEIRVIYRFHVAYYL